MAQTLEQFQTEQHIESQENARTAYMIARADVELESAAYWQELAAEQYRIVRTWVICTL